MNNDILKIISELRNADKPCNARLAVEIDGVKYDAKAIIRFWHNPFTGNKGHGISIDFKTVK